MTNTQSSNKSDEINIIGLVIGVLFAAIFSGVLIWVVSFLDLGITIDGIGTAFIAGFAIAIIGGVITWLLSLRSIKISSELLRFVFNALVGAAGLLISAQFLTGLTVNGFLGAMAASIAIGIMSWLLSLPLKRINQEVASQEDSERMP